MRENRTLGQVKNSIDDEITQLIEWNRKYPEYCPVKNIHSKFLPLKLREEFNRMRKYYEYLVQRKREGKLTEEQIKRCKNGNIRGVFGYPENVEKIAQEYKQDNELVDSAVSQYDSFDDYIEHQIESLSFGMLRKYYEINLRSDKGIEKLLCEIFGTSLRSI